jgi:hypothetical protein
MEWSARPRGWSEPEMPLARYFLFVGGVLLALLFLIDEVLPKPPVEQERAEASSDKPVIRIQSDRKWPERVVFDTNLPTIVPPQMARIEAPVRAPTTVSEVPAAGRALQAFAELKPSEPKKPEPKLPHKRKIARAHLAPPVVMVAQQPRFGFLDNNIWQAQNTW